MIESPSVPTRATVYKQHSGYNLIAALLNRGTKYTEVVRHQLLLVVWRPSIDVRGNDCVHARSAAGKDRVRMRVVSTAHCLGCSDKARVAGHTKEKREEQ
jgi:hypothetical protein